MLDITGVLIAFITSIAIHIAWCRTHPCEGLQIAPYFIFALATLAIDLVIIEVIAQNAGLRSAAVWSLSLKGSAIALFLSCMGLYLIFYFGTTVESPSRRIMILIEKSKGMTYQELLKDFTKNDLIQPRLDDLLRTGYVKLEGSSYQLTRQGIGLAKFLEIYQKLLGRPMGG